MRDNTSRVVERVEAYVDEKRVIVDLDLVIHAKLPAHPTILGLRQGLRWLTIGLLWPTRIGLFRKEGEWGPAKL